MNKYLLMTSVAIMTLGIASESWADCGTKVAGDGSVGTNAAGNKCGVCGTSGHESDCRWEIKDGVLKITGTGEMRDYSNNTGTPGLSHYHTTAPWGDLYQEFTSVDVQGVTRIGEDAFYKLNNIVDGVNIGESVRRIGGWTFIGVGTLGSLYIPKNLEYIGSYAFNGAGLTEIVVSDELTSTNVDKWSADAFGASSVVAISCVDSNGNSGNINNCKEALNRYLPSALGGNCENNCLTSLRRIGNTCLNNKLNKEGECIVASACTGEYLISGNQCIKMPGCVDYANGACGGCESGYYKKDGGCVSAQEGCGSGYLEKDSVCISSANGCGAGYKDMGGWCNRIQYTPAEAAPLLNDDNNTVTITFRK